MAMPGFSAEASLYKSARYYCHVNASGLDSTPAVGPASYFELASESGMETSFASLHGWTSGCQQSGVSEFSMSHETCASGGPARGSCGDSQLTDSNPLWATEIAPAACVMNSQGQLCCTQPDGMVKCSVPLTTPCPVGECPAGQSCCGSTCCTAGNCCSEACCSPSQACFNGCCVAIPTNGGLQPLAGASNFLFTSAPPCQNILGLTVSVNVTQEDLFAPDGFSIQLNAYNPAGPPTSWMQFVLMMNGNQIGARIEYWNMAEFNSCSKSLPPSLANIICGAAMTFNNPNLFGVQWWPAPGGETIPNLTFANTNTIPADFTLTIALQNDSLGNITGAEFSVTDDSGTIFPLTLSVDQDVQFPIVAFQLNIVGFDDSQDTTFSSGEGLITYQAQNGLCVEGELPDLCSMSVGSDTPTGENSNLPYGAISAPGCCAQSIQQSFGPPD